MDATGWLVIAGAAAASLVVILCAPALHRATRRRQDRRTASSFGGLGSGLDVVWRPTAEEAHTDWETQVELPAPAPIPGDKGRIHDGRIVIRTQRD
ncbi:hypothetical protein PU630_07535 [Microbacterium horticulturae]|uniref:Secreted protein n=1 Tax=Microbacterium horticulturae TaxID=3028316 RepID=A0ABY8C1Q7_9MICO|nr:hypothetical protein [Microbacterium sp. KACC 23027]WEG10391.1 hypothetical protein PU630_07535 [Microbacterium sp. KACC 23027]